jgi:hypothetical protein
LKFSWSKILQQAEADVIMSMKHEAVKEEGNKSKEKMETHTLLIQQVKDFHTKKK